jgi:hypothetical protein
MAISRNATDQYCSADQPVFSVNVLIYIDNIL